MLKWFRLHPTTVLKPTFTDRYIVFVE